MAHLISVPVDIFAHIEGAVRYQGTAGGDIAPPRFDPGVQWRVSPTKHIGSCDRMTAASFAALAAWLRTHAVPGLELLEGSLHHQPEWLAHLSDLPALRELRLYLRESEGIAHLPTLPGLEVLEMRSTSIDASNVAALVKHSQLRELRVSRIAVDALAPLARLRSLQSLWAGVDKPAAIMGIDRLTGLRSLTLPNGFGGNLWPQLAALPHLRELTVDSLAVPREATPFARLEAFTSTSQAATRALRWLPRLRRLTAACTDSDVAALSDLPLESLRLKAGTYTAASYATVGRMPSLLALDLSGRHVAMADSLQPLAALTSLHDLVLPSGCGEAHLRAIAGLPALRTLDLSEPSDFKAPSAKAIACLRTLQRLRIESKSCDDAAIEQIATLPALRHLDLRDCKRVTDASIPHLARLVTLEELDLHDTGVSDEGFVDLPRLPALRRLERQGFGVQPLSAPSMPIDLHDEGWYLPTEALTVAYAGEIARMPSPPYLSIQGSAPAEALRALAGSQLHSFAIRDVQAGGDVIGRLPRLWLLEAHSLDASAISQIGRIQWLTHLLLDQNEHADEVAAAMRQATSLRRVELRGRAITDPVVAALAALPTLADVTLDGCAITDAGIRGLSASRTIRRLWIRRCSEIGDDALDALGAAEQIEDLFVECGRATGSGFASWKATHQLTSLHLDQMPQLKDAAIAHLARLEHLTDIKISDAALTDRMWAHLLGARALRSLMLYGCPRLTYPTFERFQELLAATKRELRIYHRIPKKVAARDVVARVRERQMRRQWVDGEFFAAKKPGRLNPVVAKQLKRLGATPGTAPAESALLQAALREFLGYRWPSGATYALNGESGRSVSKLVFRFNSMNCCDDLLCFQERPYLLVGTADEGKILVMIPQDTEMAEDPPVYLVDRGWSAAEDSAKMTPQPLSAFLARLEREDPKSASGKG